MSAAQEREFTSEPGTPAAARQFAKEATTALARSAVPGQLCDDVELVVSELVTNAVRAGSPSVHVTVARDGGRIVVRITDQAAGWPEAREAGIHDTGGRGLPLVSAISAAWGVRMIASGKTVWAELAIPNGV